MTKLKIILFAAVSMMFLLSCSDDDADDNKIEIITDTFSELDYVKNQFFYLDDIFKQYAEEKSVRIPKIETQRIQILKRIAGLTPGKDIKFAAYGSGTQTDAFIRLEQDVDYEFMFEHPGVIRFMNKLNDSDVIGVIWHSSDGIINKTDTTNTRPVTIKRQGGSDTTVNAYDQLWILKKDEQRMNDPIYNLMLRNVYQIGTISDYANFNVNISRILSDGSMREQNDAGQYFTDILGLSENRVLLKDNSHIFNFRNGYIYIPPFKTDALNPNWAFTNPLLGTTGGIPNTNSIAYDDVMSNNAQQQYKIKITHRYEKPEEKSDELLYSAWRKAAADSKIIDSLTLGYMPPVWHHYWYQPADGDGKARYSEIYSVENSNFMNTLKLVVQPYPENQDLRNGIAAGGIATIGTKPLVSPWAGISYGISGASRDRTEDEYFEFWIRTFDSRGKLTIDFGVVGEDLSLDGKEPNDERDIEGYYSTVSESSDNGIDMAKEDFEYWFYPKFNTDGTFSAWDSLWYGNEKLRGLNNSDGWAFDPARDNWRLYDKNNLQNKKYTNGTQGNRSVKSTPDGEDIDGDGSVTMEYNASYFRYIIDLERINESPFYNQELLANDLSSGWVNIRLPVGNITDEQVGDWVSMEAFQEYKNPQWNNIRHVRMLWTGMEKQFKAIGNLDSLEFEGLRFIKN